MFTVQFRPHSVQEPVIYRQCMRKFVVACVSRGPIVRIATAAAGPANLLSRALAACYAWIGASHKCRYEYN